MREIERERGRAIKIERGESERRREIDGDIGREREKGKEENCN